MEEILSSQEKIPIEKNISIQQGFTICLNFFNDLWSIIEPKTLQLDQEASTVHMLFFVSVCTGYECSAEWNEAVFRITKIAKKEQRKGINLSAEDVFLSTVEFCKIYHKVFDFNLTFILNLLESMQSDPQKYAYEWSLWKHAVELSFTMTVFYHFDWNDELSLNHSLSLLKGAIMEKIPGSQERIPIEKNISIEQAFNICLIFFNDLWPSIEPKTLQLDQKASTVHMLFFLSVCAGYECSAEWNEAVFRVTKIPKKEQRKGLKLSAEDVFLSTVEFCKIYHKVFDFNLTFILNLLESMQSDPQKYAYERSLWKHAVDRSFKMTVFCDLNWNDELPPEKE